MIVRAQRNVSIDDVEKLSNVIDAISRLIFLFLTVIDRSSRQVHDGTQRHLGIGSSSSWLIGFGLGSEVTTQN